MIPEDQKNMVQNNCRNNKNSKNSHFSRSTFEAAVNRTPKVDFLLKQAEMNFLIWIFADFSDFK